MIPPDNLPISTSTLVRTETGVDALEPESLAPLADAAVSALLREGEAANTIASYRGALRYWAA